MTLTRQVRVWAGRGRREGSGANPGLSQSGARLAAALSVRPPLPLPPRRPPAPKEGARQRLHPPSPAPCTPPSPCFPLGYLSAPAVRRWGWRPPRYAPEGGAPVSSSRTPESRSVPGGGSTVPSDEVPPLGATYQSAVKGLKLEIWRREGRLGRAHKSSVLEGFQWAVGGAGKEPVRAQYSVMHLQHQDFFVLLTGAHACPVLVLVGAGPS